MSARALQFDGVVRLTRAGAGFLLFAFCIGFAALNTGNNSLYVVFAMMLSCLIFSGIVSRFGLKSISLEVEELGDVWAEEPAHAIVRVRNGSRWIEVRDLVVRSPDLDGTAIIDRLPPRHTEDVVVRFIFRRRGRVELRQLDIYTMFPFGFFTKKRQLRIDTRGIVYPNRRSSSRARRWAPDSGDMRVANRAGEGQDLFAMRDYREGESIRHIHWKRSAGSGRWIVWQGSAESSDRLHVIFDAVTTAASDSDFENLVSGATGYIAEAVEGGQAVVLHIGNETFASDTGPAGIFTALALVERRSEGALPPGPAGSVVFSLRHDTN